MLGLLKPSDTVEPKDVDRGMHVLMFDGIASQIMASLTMGAFLVAFALALGASNKVIGLLAALGPITQTLQIPAIYLVDRTRARKAIVVVSNFLGRLAWIVVALLPWLAPEPARLPIFLVAVLVYFALGAIGGCAFNSWVRDLIPEERMGRYFARRMALSIAIGAGLSLAAGVGVDLWQKHTGETFGIYTVLFATGAVAGLAGLWFLARTPEPRMAPPPKESLLRTVAGPFRDARFRSLLSFLGSWNFAIHFAAPFFTVYMLQRLGLAMAWVLALAVLSQIVHVLFLKLWGGLADRFTNKSVLAASGPLFLVSIIAWPFTTMPERYVLTIPLLVGIHVLAGMSAAGVTLCAGNIALRAAPRGRATAYLAVNALVSGVAAALGPILAGVVGDFFADKQLSLDLAWIAGEAEPWRLPAMSLRGLDFLFVISFALGLYSLQRLAAVREEGEVEEEIVRAELFSEVRRSVRQVSTAGGLRYLTYFPFALLSGAISVTSTAAAGLGLRKREVPSEGADPERPPGEEPPSPPDPGTP